MGQKLNRHEFAGCTSVSRYPPRKIVPLRAAGPFGSATNVTVRDPAPVAPCVTAIHAASLRAFHRQSIGAVTVIPPPPPSCGIVIVVNGNALTHALTVIAADAPPAGPRGANAVIVVVPIS